MSHASTMSHAVIGISRLSTMSHVSTMSHAVISISHLTHQSSVISYITHQSSASLSSPTSHQPSCVISRQSSVINNTQYITSPTSYDL